MVQGWCQADPNNFQNAVTWRVRCAPEATSMFGGDSGVDFKAAEGEVACFTRLDFRL